MRESVMLMLSWSEFDAHGGGGALGKGMLYIALWSASEASRTACSSAMILRINVTVPLCNYEQRAMMHTVDTASLNG